MMASFVKADLVQYTELLYALSGHLDTRYYVDVSDHTTIQWTEFKDTFAVGDGLLPQVADLLDLAALYIQLKDDYLCNFSIGRTF